MPIPPPPPPPPQLGGGLPPPPPPPPGGRSSAPASSQKRGALLQDIHKGRALRKAVTNDRSAPLVGAVVSGGGSAPSIGAPPVPGAPKAPGSFAPPVPGPAPTVPSNRARSNSDQGNRQHSPNNSLDSAPQLGGLFAGGMPKLRKTGGAGINTGANRDSSYLSDLESSAPAAPRPSSFRSAPKPLGLAPPVPGRAAPSSQPVVPSVASLRRTADGPRPLSSASMFGATKGPPPPIGKKPPPRPGTRKPSSIALSSTAPPIHSSSPLVSAAPPPPPSAAPKPRSAPSRTPLAPPPPPSINGNISQSIFAHAALRATSSSSSSGLSSPAAAPPAPPPPRPPPPSSLAPASPPHPPPSAPSSLSSPPSAPVGITRPAPAPASAPLRSILDPSNFTLAHNGAGASSTSSPPHQRASPPSGFTLTPWPLTGEASSGPGGRYIVQDPRWKFVSEDKFPKPRDFVGGPKKYRAGRGSSVPLDLGALAG